MKAQLFVVVVGDETDKPQTYEDPEIYGPFNQDDANQCLKKLRISTPGFDMAIIPLKPMPE